ncbi:MAG: cation:proton antiporter [Desulfobulbaceae bacterium]|nr:cation:proton antiporter [Desulfobulbaceae bacterium]
MQETTLVLAILLSVGFAAAKLGQLIRLPSVTGYIVAGLILGPSGFHLVTADTIGRNLEHFTQIALMLIAFGIGEHLDMKRLQHSIKSVGCIGLAETTGAFLFVGIGTFLMALSTDVGAADWRMIDFAALALLLGAVSVATAPAATLLVMRELKAAGPLTTILMAVVAVDDGLAIMMFGMAVSAARHLVGIGGSSILTALLSSLFEIFGSLFLGVITGLSIDYIVNKLRSQSEMLTVGLALLLLCGEGARMFGLSPLLAGMAAGFTIVNRDFRDVRLFRALNAFEPPVYVLFFTLAGSQLHLSALVLAGWLGLAYFLLRVFGKIIGAFVGGRIAAAPVPVQLYLGYALVPQAGVAIGLIFLIQGDPELAVFSSIITPVVLAGVVISELLGPVSARYAVEKAGEAAGRGRESSFPDLSDSESNGQPKNIDEFQLIPWTWELLQPASFSDGFVLFGTAHSATAPGLTRMATLIAHYHGALPMAVQVKIPGKAPMNGNIWDVTIENLATVQNEINSLGYRMVNEVVLSDDVASGILATAQKHKTWCILLGYPLSGTAKEFQQVVESVAHKALCPVIVVRFTGILHTERILVPIVSSRDLHTVSSVTAALSGVGRHRVTLLRLMPSNATEKELELCEQKMLFWAEKENLTPYVHCQAIATESRQETILHEVCKHDLLVMAASESHGFKRIFFGSLAENIARECNRPMLMVYSPRQ